MIQIDLLVENICIGIKVGGAIGLIATTRQIGVTTGFVMNNLFSEDLYAFGSNDYPTIAEALRLTKFKYKFR